MRTTRQTLTELGVTQHPSTTSRQHYFHRAAPPYMERRICFRSLTPPDPRNPGEAADLPSFALMGTLSPSDGEREGVRGLTLIPQTSFTQACGSGSLSLLVVQSQESKVGWRMASLKDKTQGGRLTILDKCPAPGIFSGAGRRFVP